MWKLTFLELSATCVCVSTNKMISYDQLFSSKVDLIENESLYFRHLHHLRSVISWHYRDNIYVLYTLYYICYCNIISYFVYVVYTWCHIVYCYKCQICVKEGRKMNLEYLNIWFKEWFKHLCLSGPIIDIKIIICKREKTYLVLIWDELWYLEETYNWA